MDSGSSGGWVMIRQNATDQELEQLETCIGSLYEDLDAKVKATGMILELSQRMECLAALASHGSALCALARVLREEGRKSFILRRNIISIFFIFSFFKNFHRTLVGQNVGRTTLQVLALEIQITETLQPSKERCNKELTQGNPEQERLLFMSINLLLNLAHNPHIEEKMKKFFLVELLCKALDCRNIYLLLITLAFLKKLSIIRENKDTMKENGIIFKIACMLPCSNEIFMHAILGLLHNLSFDLSMKTQIVDSKLIQALEPLLVIPKFEHSVAGIFYNVSVDAKLRVRFAETEVMATIAKMLLSEPMRSVSKEMMALVVNLTTVTSIAEPLCKPFVIDKLLKRAKHFCDPLLFKVLRNISHLDDAKSFLLCSVPELVSLLLESEPSVQVEIMGILNNMVCLEETSDLHVRKNLLQHFATTLLPGVIEPDILLEICIFLGSVCSTKTAAMICEAGLVGKMCYLFLERNRDIDLTVQLLYLLSRFLLFEPTKKEMLTFTEKMATYTLELIKDSNKAIAKLGDTLYNMMMEVDDVNYVKLKWLRFAMFNRDGLQYLGN